LPGGGVPVPFTTFDTVLAETPTRSATSFSVGRPIADLLSASISIRRSLHGNALFNDYRSCITVFVLMFNVEQRTKEKVDEDTAPTPFT
jgi:hypothetical protein